MWNLWGFAYGIIPAVIAWMIDCVLNTRTLPDQKRERQVHHLQLFTSIIPFIWQLNRIVRMPSRSSRWHQRLASSIAMIFVQIPPTPPYGKLFL
jgi:hypothetical protein